MRHYTDRLFFDDSNKSEGRFGRWSGLKAERFPLQTNFENLSTSFTFQSNKMGLNSISDVTADLFSRLKIG
jgi:hypothetical protein